MASSPNGNGMLKAVILIGGPLKGTRFRPLSLDIPKPLFPVAGFPMLQHQIEACVRIPELKEILVIGYYPSPDIIDFVHQMADEYKVAIRYYQEYEPLGTGGGVYHFRDFIKAGNPSGFFIMNGDVCGDFPFAELRDFYYDHDDCVIVALGTEATRNQSINYGCIVAEKNTSEIIHYVEKPSTFVSTIINCGVYLCSMKIFSELGNVFQNKGNADRFENYPANTISSSMSLEEDILIPLAGTGKAFVYQTKRWWSQMKTAASAIYANRHYLQLYEQLHPERLIKRKNSYWKVYGDVYVHPTARIDSTAVIGPNVSIGAYVVIKAGVRIRESIILCRAKIEAHTLVLNCVVGRDNVIGPWARVEGTPCDPNPNKPFAKMDNLPLFSDDGRLNPSITILGGNVKVSPEVVILNTIVLPYKELTRSFKNEIIL